MTLPNHQAASPTTGPPTHRPDRLNSWKEIASYFDRDIRTVQLWEKHEGLPIHRLGHIARSTVYAYPHELERWLTGRHGVHVRPATVPPSIPVTMPAIHLRGRGRFLWIAATALIVISAAVLVTWKMHYGRQPVAAVSVVLADFVNTTGEQALDNALNTALLAKLQQTPFLVFLPQPTIQLALRYMGRHATDRMTLAVAREVCLREGGQVVLQGSITGSSPAYSITLRAWRCADNKLLTLHSSTADSSHSVLRAIDQAAEAIRSALGESAASIRAYNVSVSDATTGSLDALLAYSQGDAVWKTQGESAALPYFQHALQIDSNFVLAYERLGTIYGNRGDSQRSQEAVRKAWELRDRVTERERFYVDSHLYGFVTGDIEKEMHVYQEWSKVYPHDPPWMIDLSVDYGYTGQFDKAITLMRRFIQENPGISYSYGDLAGFYLAEERPDEARAVLDQALQNHVEDPNTRIADYGLAFYRNDLDALDRITEAAAHQAGLEDTLLAQQAMTQDTLGRIVAGQGFALHAASLAAAAHETEIQANWLTAEAVRQAEMGAPRQARSLLKTALALPSARNGRNALVWSAHAYALVGDFKAAQVLIDILNRDYPLDTLIQSYWLPNLRARIAFSKAQYGEALRLTAASSPFDLGIFSPGQCMDQALLRGQILLAAGQAPAATQQFRNVLSHRGLVLNCPTGALAQLGLARSLTTAGDTAAGRAAYQDLFTLWKNADPGLPLLHQAQAEYRSLPH